MAQPRNHANGEAKKSGGGVEGEQPITPEADATGARPKHGTSRKYVLLAPAGTAVNPSDVGDSGSETVHGATEDQDGREPEEEGGETQQRAAIT